VGQHERVAGVGFHPNAESETTMSKRPTRKLPPRGRKRRSHHPTIREVEKRLHGGEEDAVTSEDPEFWIRLPNEVEPLTFEALG
jgi:hypothetical protein